MSPRTELLKSGSRVAVIGGGISGCAAAVSLLQASRARGRTLHVQVFEHSQEDPVRPPVVLSAECRARLSALGCRVFPSWRTAELSSVEICRAGQVERLPVTRGGLWVVEGTGAESGRKLLSSAIGAVATLEGASFAPRAVERVERDGGEESTLPPLVVRARGRPERFHAVLNASGAGGALGEDFFPGFAQAPTLPAAHARIALLGDDLYPPVLRFILSPLPGLDGLYLVPGRRSLYALAFGPWASSAQLCEALMTAARDGLLPERFEVFAISPTRVPNGVSPKPLARGLAAVGSAAVGHPFQLTVSAALASSGRAAVALVESGVSHRALKTRYWDEGAFDLRADAKTSAAANRWLRGAGPGAVAAFVRGRQTDTLNAPWASGLLGLTAPTPQGLLRRARAFCLGNSVQRWLGITAGDQVRSPPVCPKSPLIYLVDDDAQVRDGLSEYLRSRGSRVIAFADELALYCAVARRPPTAVLLDVVLQWVDGLSLLEGLKRHPITWKTPVWIMSGINRPHIRLRAMSAGAEGFLPKPVDPELLFQKLMGLQTQSAEAKGLKPVGSALWKQNPALNTEATERQLPAPSETRSVGAWRNGG